MANSYKYFKPSRILTSEEADIAIKNLFDTAKAKTNLEKQEEDYSDTPEFKKEFSEYLDSMAHKITLQGQKNDKF